MGVVQVFVTRHILERLRINDGCLQREFVDFLSCGGYQFSGQVVQVEVGEKRCCIMLQNFIPSISCAFVNKGCQIQIVCHFLAYRSGGLILCRCGLLVVDASHIEYGHRANR